MNEELENQSTFCMRIDCVNVTNDDFFTKQRLSDWGIHIAKCCLNICETLINKVEPSYHVQYFVSEALINEVVCDAVIGMGKIIDKTPHPVEHPNAFKIAAYLGYWFLRHKPTSILYPQGVDLNQIKTAADVSTDVNYLIWQLKHINESVAVNIVTTYIFDFDNELCDKTICKKIKSQNTCDGKPAFAFDDFNQQRKIMLQKLTYYFTYRAIAPKVIEHMLEGYAFHPAWNLTGPHWDTKIQSDVTTTEDKKT